MGYLYLAIAIVSEVVATSALKASAGLTRLTPAILVILGYGCAFFALSQVIKTIPVGIAYAIWSGVGIVLITLAAAVLYRQIPDTAAITGMTLIIAGVVIINAFSNMSVH